MKTTSISISLLGPATMNMTVVSVNPGHVDGNLVMLKNDLYKIPFIDKTNNWKLHDKVEVEILNPIKAPLQIPLDIRKIQT